MPAVETIRQDWLKRGRFQPVAPYPRLTEDGLVLGSSMLVARKSVSPERMIAGRERRILALLSAAYGAPVPSDVIGVLRRAAKAWAKGDKSLAAILIAQMGLPRLIDGDEGSYRLFMAAGLLDDGLDPATLLKAWNIATDALDQFDKFNPDHDELGRFASGSGAGTSDQPIAGDSRVKADPDTPAKRTDKVDWDTIREFEGGQRVQGYVPHDKDGHIIGKSGVTIATGFDIGQHTKEDLERMGLSQGLIDKLTPYTKPSPDQPAKSFTNDDAKHLNVTKEEADEIDTAAQRQILNQVRAAYDKTTAPRGGSKFDDLPTETQTAIASVAFQMGPAFGTKEGPAAMGKQFWQNITEQNWAVAAATLRQWGPRSLPRRHKEADLIDRGAGAEK